jgi:hypothetical protein
MYDVIQKPQLKQCAPLAIRFLISNYCTIEDGVAVAFKGLSWDGEWRQAKFSENLSSSPFNKDLSNDSTFS